MKKYLGIGLAVCLFLTACGNDDDSVVEISIEEQNAQDDGSIQTFLNSYYMDDLGRAVAFDENDTSDDDNTPLADVAQPISDGVYIIKNPNVDATGPTVTNSNTQSILLNYDFRVFSSAKDDEGNYLVNFYQSVTNTVNTTGFPTWDVPFFREDIDDDNPFTEDHYEMEGFKEAITYFNATNKAYEEPYVFQGIVIIASRKNYARDTNFYNLRNQVAVVQFEMYSVQDD